MFSIDRIEIENFRSFKGRHTFKFPKAPGLYAITGKNLSHHNLGANAVGKSTLLESIYWCDYGHTTRGLKAANIINWRAKSCVVTLHQSIGVVRRSQGPNSLTLNDNPVDQLTLQSSLLLGPEDFTYSVMFPQFGQAFFDKAPGDKLTLFSTIMKLDYWLTKSKQADQVAKEVDVERIQYNERMANFNGKIETTENDIVQLSRSTRHFANEQKLLITHLTEELKGLENSLTKLTNELNHANDGTRAAKARALSVSNKIKSFVTQRDVLKAEAEKVFAHKLTFENDLSAVKNVLCRLEGLTAECPVCLQKVDTAHLKTERVKQKDRLKRVMSALAACVKESVQVANALDKSETNIESHERDLRTIESNLADFEARRRALEYKLSQSGVDRERLTERMKAEQSKPNPYALMVKEKEAQLLSLKRQAKEVKNAIRLAEQDHAAISHWVGGFKRIRLVVIEETLRQLELEINNNLACLGLIDWNIELDIERENKSGGVTKGFTVLVRAPGHNEPVKFETWSGGETQRLRLAGDLGLANLIMERAGLKNTIEFFDEPSRHLSQEGILDLAETLHERALTSGKRIFVVEHNLPDYPYTGTIEIVKDKEGSHISMSN